MNTTLLSGAVGCHNGNGFGAGVPIGVGYEYGYGDGDPYGDGSGGGTGNGAIIEEHTDCSDHGDSDTVSGRRRWL